MLYQSPLGIFPNRRSCAAAHGVSPQTVSSVIAKHGDLNKLGTGSARPNNGRTPRTHILADGRRMTSAQLAQHTGISLRTINWWIQTRRMDMLVAALMRADQC